MWAGLDDLSDGEALSALRWWRDAGVDVLIDEQPRNWLDPRPLSSEGDSRQTRREGVSQSSLPASLEALRSWLETTDALPDGSIRGRRLLPSGDPASGFMVMLDMPEPADRAGLLEGAEGRLFDNMLAAIGLSRERIYLASVCLARPPGGRLDPATLQAVATLARHHVALAAPQRLLLLGDLAVRALLGADAGARRNHCHELDLAASELVNPIKINAVATMAPRLLLKQPALKRQAWKDLRLLMRGSDGAC